MNARLVSISLSLAVAMIAASSLAQGRGGGASGGGGMGGGHGMGGMQGGGMPSGVQRGNESAPAARQGDVQQDRGRSASAERQAPEQAQGKTPQELLQQNTRLSDNLAKSLPAGTDLQAAASGFKNLGEFVSAVHVSNNLGIPFADLKARMLGGDSLGAAIHSLKPGANAQGEANRARAQAERQLKG